MGKGKVAVLSVLMVLLGFILIQNEPSLAIAPKKVAILPFTMNADRDLSFLQEGILDMLSSRLAWKGKVDIIEKGKVRKTVDGFPPPLDTKKALEIGRLLGADYVVLGSLTVFGESVSIDAKILDVSKSDVVVTAFDQSKGMDTVIPTVNQFAEDINDKIMGRKVREPVREAAPKKAEQGAIVAVEREAEGPKRPSYINRFKIEIRGLDVGDVDGDGKKEMVFIDKTTVYVYKWQKNTFFELTTAKGSWSPNYIYVSVADLDGNGRAEIYVSSLSAKNVSSLVLEWDGNRLKTIISGSKWLMRVVDLPGKGKTLIGQQRATAGSYLGDVYVLKRKDNTLHPEEPVKLPRRGTVFNFVMTTFGGKGEIFTTLLDPYEYLCVYNQKNERLWRSDDYFGGTLAYMEVMELEGTRDTPEVDTGRRVFIPSPIFLIDLNKDGKQELVICQNHSKTARVSDVRWFSSGIIHFMTWDGIGLVSRWTSQKLPGAAVGYQVDDVDGDGLLELIVASVTGESYFMGMPRSQVVVYDLD
jgi:TolB-like protein